MIGSAEEDPLSIGSPAHFQREIPGTWTGLVEIVFPCGFVEVTDEGGLSQDDSLIGFQGGQLTNNFWIRNSLLKRVIF